MLPPTNENERKQMLSVLKSATTKIESGEIGHLRETDTDLIGRKVIMLEGPVPKKIALELLSIDWKKGTAKVNGGKYGQHEVPIDNLRRIDAVYKTIEDAKQN